MPTWTCPTCHRTFRQPHQRHACGTGDRARIVAGRPRPLVALYGKLERAVRSFGQVEIVTRDRYALFRTTRIFADAVMMRDALRLAIHLDQRVKSPRFFKVAGSGRRVSHVALLREEADLEAMRPFLKQAFELASSEDHHG
jgi:hypothetical protein